MPGDGRILVLLPLLDANVTGIGMDIKVLVDGVEDGLREPMRFEQAAELEQGGGVGCGFAREIDADEAADRLAVVEGILRAFVRQTEALLCEVQARRQVADDAGIVSEVGGGREGLGE